MSRKPIIFKQPGLGPGLCCVSIFYATCSCVFLVPQVWIIQETDRKFCSARSADNDMLLKLLFGVYVQDHVHSNRRYCVVSSHVVWTRSMFVCWSFHIACCLADCIVTSWTLYFTSFLVGTPSVHTSEFFDFWID
jgi:uncharacterized membrane protein YkgB